MHAYRQLSKLLLLLPASLLVACGEAPVDESSPEVATAAVNQAATSTGIASEAGNAVSPNAITEAPTGFDNLSNGFLTAEEMTAAEDVFANEVEEVADGLGPVYNAQSCRECHQNPVVGAGAATSELRAGHMQGTTFVEPPGGSLINDRALDPSIQERIPAGNEVNTFRLALSIMGDGFVECIDSNVIANIVAAQPVAQRGTVIQVPVLEAPGQNRVGRFGWKNQNSSLLSFAADAYVNEMGITNPLIPQENTSLGRSVAQFDTVADPEDTVGADIASFTQFMRALKAPPVDAVAAATASARAGSTLFDQIGCAVCHVRSINTVPAGTVVNGGQFTCPAALGDKTIHPFSDFALHNIGTGDGIGQGPAGPTLVRTAPLWGMRARDRLMHDGNSVRRSDAINRHAGQASAAQSRFAGLSTAQQNNVIDFLNSL